ncbi:MAG: ArnT family glycosyltransferase [Candidatus Binatia bacterium]
MSRSVFYALVALGLALRVWMLTHYSLVSGGDVDVYLADEGIVGLMAKHILEHGTTPVFFYGQSYLGALEAYCAAAVFAVFGVGLLQLRLVPFLFSIALGVLVYRFAYRFYSVAVARWATVLVAIGPFYFLQWNLKARGGFVEHVFLLFVVMLLFWSFYLYRRRDRATAFALGLASGVALWVNQLVGAYLAVMAGLLWLDREDRRGWTAALVGLALGASLLIGYNVVNPLATVRSLARKALVMNRVDVEERDEAWARRGLEERLAALGDGFDKLGIVFGVPPGADVERLGLSEEAREGGPLAWPRRSLFLLPLVVFGVAVLAARPRRGPGGWSATGSDQLLGLFFLVTFAVGYVSPRYMLPAYPLAAILAAALVVRLGGARRFWMTGGLVAVMLFHVAGWVDAALTPTSDEEARGERLVSWLDDRGIRACYSASPLYHLVFQGEEKVVISPLQKNRYPAYDAVIEAAGAICYVFREDQQDKRQHLAMMALLEAKELRYESSEVGPYRVLHDFVPRSGLKGVDVQRVRSTPLRALPARGTEATSGGARRDEKNGSETENR